MKHPRDRMFTSINFRTLLSGNNSSNAGRVLYVPSALPSPKVQVAPAAKKPRRSRKPTTTGRVFGDFMTIPKTSVKRTGRDYAQARRVRKLQERRRLATVPETTTQALAIDTSDALTWAMEGLNLAARVAPLVVATTDSSRIPDLVTVNEFTDRVVTLVKCFDAITRDEVHNLWTPLQFGYNPFLMFPIV